MKLYQIYFFFLKGIVALQLVLVALRVDFAHNALFAFADALFRLSLGLFLGFYIWFFPPKGMDWEDSILISIAGFLLLADIKFKPIIAAYEKRDELIAKAGEWLGIR
jgi:hypothetical protein